MQFLEAVLSVFSLCASPEALHQQSFWQAYFIKEKERALYLSSLVKHLPQDVLNVILHSYMDVINNDQKGLSYSLFNHFLGKSAVSDVYKHRSLVLTNDTNYYIAARQEAPMPIVPYVALFDAITHKEIQRFNHKERFVYLRKSNKLVLYSRGLNKQTIIIYDFITQTMSEIDVSQEKNIEHFSINNRYCFIGSSIIDLATMTKVESLHECDYYICNQVKDLFVGIIKSDDTTWLRLFKIEKSGIVQTKNDDFVLPFCPGHIRFMRDDYIVLFYNGQRGVQHDFLHLFVDRDNQYLIKDITSQSAGNGCRVQDSNKNFFVCQKDWKHLRVVAYDGSLVKEKEDFFVCPARFSKNGNYYIAKNSDASRGGILFLLSLNAVSKKAVVVESDEFGCGSRVKSISFDRNNLLFLANNELSVEIGTLNGKKIGSVYHSKKNNTDRWKFSPESDGIINVTQGIKYSMPSAEVLASLAHISARPLNFYEYFLLESRKNDKSTQELYKKSSSDCKFLYDALTARKNNYGE